MVRLTDRRAMTIAVDWNIKNQTNHLSSSIMRHFIRVCTVCKVENRALRQKCIQIKKFLPTCMASKIQNVQFHTYSINMQSTVA